MLGSSIIFIEFSTFDLYHVCLVIPGPECPHRESFDFKLFILVYQEYLVFEQ